MTDSNLPSVTALSARIVSSFASKNRLSPSELPALIASVRAALDSVGGPAPVEPQEPAVPLRKLISADAVYCAECGAKFKSLKRHLGTEHNLTPHAYIQKWGLKPDHPMVAPNYSATRSALAKSMGLGSGGRKAAVAPVKANKAPAKTVAPVPSKPARRGKAVAAGADSASK